MQTISCKRHGFPPDFFRPATWPHAPFILSFRDVKERFAERSLDISHETGWRWFLEFSARIAFNLRLAQPTRRD